MTMYVARFWVDCFDYQSNTVILAELVFRGRPQPVHNLACNKQQKLRNLTKSEFFYALVARFCSLLYCFLWLGW